MPNFETILVCDERNAIYAEHDGKLYELKFSDISDTDFHFTEIHGADLWSDNKNQVWESTYLQMECMPKSDQLFAMKCATSIYNILAQPQNVPQERMWYLRFCK